MAKENNLKDFLTDIANAIRSKKGTTDLINPQDFSAEIASIETGGSVPSYPNGIYIQHIDGRLFNAEEWTLKGYPNDEANGVAVVSDFARFVISLKSSGSKWWSSTDTFINGVMLTTDVNIAKTDYAGEANTALIATGAAFTCRSFSFPNGQKGYLPALGEWIVAFEYKSDIDTIMSLIGGAPIGSNYLWSSTQYSKDVAYMIKWSDRTTYTLAKTSTNCYVRAFGPLVI